MKKNTGVEIYVKWLYIHHAHLSAYAMYYFTQT